MSRVWFTRRERRRKRDATARWHLEGALAILRRVRRKGHERRQPDANLETIVERSVLRFRRQLEALRNHD